MIFFISFLEGVLTFISPCFLPMLPVYLSYFMGDLNEQNKKNIFKNSIGFVIGFTIVFVLFGALSSTIGGFLIRNRVRVNIVSGLIIILFGLSFLNVVKLPFSLKRKNININFKGLHFLSSVLFGIVFAFTLSFCVGVFLGSALMRAAHTGETMVGVLMLFSYSLGLGVPLVLSGLLIDKLSASFAFIKNNYDTINLFSGIFLIMTGVLTMTGMINRF